MSLKTVSVSLASEVDDAASALRDLVVALKAGKSPLDIVKEELATAVKVFGELNQLPADFSIETQESLAALSLRLSEVGAALLGKYKAQ